MFSHPGLVQRSEIGPFIVAWLLQLVFNYVAFISRAGNEKCQNPSILSVPNPHREKKEVSLFLTIDRLTAQDSLCLTS
jgi:hypothetical protein